jgi:hypothetical protein
VVLKTPTHPLLSISAPPCSPSSGCPDQPDKH